MNVSLNSHFERFVRDAVASGRFKSSSEVVRQGLRLLEERETRLAALRLEIDKGRQSGDPVRFDAKAIKARGRQARHRRTGQRA